MSCVLLWLRNDLRVSDHPALVAAASQATQLGLPLLPVCLDDPAQAQPTRWVAQRMGPHRRAWLAGSMRALDAQLQARGSRLLVLQGAAERVLPELMARCKAVALHTEALHAPDEAQQTQSVSQAAAQLGCELTLHAQSTLLRLDQLPWPIQQMPGVFTAFRQQVEQAGVTPRVPLDAPRELPPLPSLDAPRDTPRDAPQLRALESRSWSPTEGILRAGKAHPDDTGINNQLVSMPAPFLAAPACPPEPRSSFPYHQPAFAPGEAAAQAHLAQYLARQLPHSYKATRNGLSGLDFSSKFSPWLATGALSAPQVMAALRRFEAEHGASDGSYWLWFELLWRDHFHLLHAKHGAALYRARGLSQLPAPPHDEAAFQRWCAGQTGESLVDAGMRELAATGWLSNRMRQIVASYLIHDLACDWRAGAAWFESRLIDFDVHSNQGNWLYIAGRGTDPRGGRRFNPDKQTRDHDPDGAYRNLWGCA
jgi:deoxyribodipyrimidine photo-lyase